MEKLFEKTDYEIELFEDDLSFEFNNVFNTDEFIIRDDCDKIIDQWRENRLEVVYKTFEKEYEALVKKGKCFFGCPFDLYEETFDNRLSTFMSEDKNLTVISFVENELNEGILLFNRPYVHPKKMQIIQSSLRLRFEFLIKKAYEKNYLITLKENDTANINYFHREELISENELIQIESENFTKKHWIIALHKLGVLEYLYNHPKIKNTNKVAVAIRSFTGLKATTIQSYINPILSKNNVDQSKSALDDENQIMDVNKYLSNHVFR